MRGVRPEAPARRARLRRTLAVVVPLLLLAACGGAPPTSPAPPVEHALKQSVSPVGAGTVGRDPDRATYGHGATVTLSAKAAPGYQFVRWEGDAAGSGNPVTVVMDSDKAVTAVFATAAGAQFTLSVIASPPGAGSVIRNPDQAQYVAGTIVTLTAVPAQGYQFVRWDGDLASSVNPATVVMNANKSASAVFAASAGTRYNLAVSVSPSQGGTVTRNPTQADYVAGAVVTLTATPASGYQFTRWEGDVTGSSNPATITMTGDKAVTAVFTAAGTRYTLAVGASPIDGGTVSRSPVEKSYAPGTSVTLTASPGSGYRFDRWEGDVTGSTNPVRIVMDADRSMTAVFTVVGVPVVVAGTPSRATGAFAISVTYDWGPTVSDQDWLELEEAAGSAQFVKIAQTPGGDRTSPWTVTLTRPGGRYMYRARAHLGSMYSGYSVTAPVNVLPPTTITVFASFDNGVAMSSQDPALANTVYSSGEIGAGYDFLASTLASYESKGTGAALKFDVQPQIAGRAIASATLRLYVRAVRVDLRVAPMIQVNAFSSDWKPGTITWNTWAGLQFYWTGEVRQPAPASAGQPLDFDVTTIVQNWASGSFGNYGLRLSVAAWYPGYAPSLGTTYFQSLETSPDSDQRPQIIVSFR